MYIGCLRVIFRRGDEGSAEGRKGGERGAESSWEVR